MSVDAIIVGAGFSGAVLAERFASQLGWKVLVLEQRPHIGGNCYDEPDAHGVLVHRYGPHLFHTDNPRVWDYLSAFTEWRPYEHKVLSSIDGQLVPIPFNLNSIDRLFDADTATCMREALVSRFGLGARVPILRLKEEDEPLLRELADFVYRKAFLNYTTKQWGVKPEEISPEVTGRVPVVVDRDDRYFTDPYQAVPAEGYTKLFEKLLAHPHITVRLDTPFNAVGSFDPDTGAVQFEGAPFGGLLVFTGMVDELFGRDRGALPYRSIRFDFQHHAVPVFQPATTVNYPNEHRYTRITEFKHLTGQQCAGTSIVYEYPQAYDPADPEANVPYYPIFDERSKAAYTAYADRLGGHTRVVAVGRLAQYRYFDMDDAVANALQVFDRIAAAQG
ncbi:MAG TPA: UDP-galactopyranose mutase [Rhodocyclaceae bacterium]|nr:UDP-galactopyranose mutase [Rhodocyclaceae bacterium]